MPPTAIGGGPVVRWIGGFWQFYRGYIHTAIHAASAAALTAFGLLAIVDRLFVVVAIAAYVCPPLVLYGFGADVGVPGTGRGNGVSDTDASDTDTDGRDIDTDTDDDADADGLDGDSDSDG